MGATTSRENSTRLSLKQHEKTKRRRKLPSLKTREIEPKLKQLSSSPPVNLVKHQVVLSDHISPVSSLSAIISIPTHRSSWRKSFNTLTTRTTANENTSMTSSSSSCCFEEEEEEEMKSSPRTSVGSEEQHLKLIPENEYIKKKRTTGSSFSSFKSGLSKKDSDIVFEPAKFNPNITNDLKSFWSYNNDEKEYNRQLRQHFVLKHILQGNIHVPVPKDKPIVILDAACGAGFWTLDMTSEFPNAKIIGLDTFVTEDKRMKNNNSTNIVYKYGDLTTHLSLPNNYLDIIYQRDTTSILPHERWSFLFQEQLRVLKPGGYIELVEYDFRIRDPGPVLALVNEWYKVASNSVGVNPKQAKHLKELIASAGFVDIEQKTVSIPIGEWPDTEVEKEKGFLNKFLIKGLFKSMKSWWIHELAVSEQEYDKVFEAAMEEFSEQRCSIDWIIYTARKPLNTPTSSIYEA
ncbi:S-adenosyl-L-methionine-dependent methyltransferase [Gilbertella persicaria]|uniref:S-adenosyl-L-methionine-dependent methyltransferase n=1 Tax=Gilbertella persicaria TaxID=101096 RepID=UPI00221F1819|nr:S-adenosyl-L-methionine-dependent methyltransferase [Gilbertella persicaria]KAI8081991.1 S-adenosyl-L-methionine-dependent methyltransferase [Gilbertella persicaria]